MAKISAKAKMKIGETTMAAQCERENELALNRRNENERSES
jgi:hypothetical protein